MSVMSRRDLRPAQAGEAANAARALWREAKRAGWPALASEDDMRQHVMRQR
jgi:hypothetical protein